MPTGKRVWTTAAILGMLVAAWAAPPAGAQLRAGAAAVDTTWHVGASAGQYAGDCFLDGPDTEKGCNFVTHQDGTFDPTGHSIRRRPSYGIQSRLSARAVVIEGSNGARHAIVKNDQYIPQDLVYRRAAQLLEERGECAITRETLTVAATHNHSSPMYSSTSWGVWAFQDVFDVRFFNYLAERMYRAVERACARLVPARIGAAVGRFGKTHRHSFGPATADDGTPAGYPEANTDHDMTVIRLDDVSRPGRPKPLANLVNFSLHPEFLEGNDLISADFIGPLERMADRETGALTVFTQGAVGTSEPERSVWHDVSERLEFSHRDYAQAEYGARLMANKLVRLWRGIGSGRAATRGARSDRRRYVAPVKRSVLRSIDRWYPGPFSHPYPGVSNCRSDKGLGGDPQLPIIGLPDCNGVNDGLGTITDVIGVDNPAEGALPLFDPGLSTDDFQAAGIPIPENYSAPSYTGLEEDIDIHLQAVRIGPILLTMCSCEQWFDQSANIETRTDRIAGNEHLGYSWAKVCGTAGDWACPDPLGDLAFPGDQAVERMEAQVFNPANGWNDAANALSAESEPTDPEQIKGNFTHDDRCSADPHRPGNDPCGGDRVPVSKRLGYRLTVPIGMTNDYNGYIASYREYQRGDHYRKALTAWGPHSSDYMATRLVTMGRQLMDPDLVVPLDQRQESVLAAKAALDTEVNDLRAEALGEVGAAAVSAFEDLLPADGGEAEAIEQPQSVERFDAATFTWAGGSNFVDDPRAVVQRRAGRSWRTYADMSGEVPVTLEFPAYDEAFDYLGGSYRWRWSAHFEAFAGGFDTGRRPRATPSGRYRFRVVGRRKQADGIEPYRLVSKPFRVRPWSGITVRGIHRHPDGRITFRTGPSTIRESESGEVRQRIGPIDYPDSYDAPVRFIQRRWQFIADPERPRRGEWFCFTCSFRPWLDSGRAAKAAVRIIGSDGTTRTIRARPRSARRWVTVRPARGRKAFVAAGAVRDRFGNRNGNRSRVVRLDASR